MNKSILVSGNSYIDNIICTNGLIVDGNNICESFSKSLGGVFNFLKVLKSSNHHIFSALSHDDRKLIANQSRYVNLNITPTKSVCTSTIICDKKNSQRTSFTVNGSSRNFVYKNKNYYDYHHISYLDNLPNYTLKTLKEIKNNCGFLSADLCKQKMNDKEIRDITKKIKLIDMLICSVSEIKTIFKTDSIKQALFYLKKHVPFYVIHSPTKIYAKGEKYFHLKVSYKKNLNVLGAGDVFCAYVLINMSTSMKLEKAVELAVSQTLKKLKNET